MRLIQLVLALVALVSGMTAYADEQTDNSEANQETARKVMGDDLPDFRTILGLPSLTDEQRDQIQGMMVNYKQEVAPLRQEADAIRSAALQGGSLTPEQMQEATKYIQSGTMPSTTPAESKVLGRVTDLKEQVKEKRNELWSQIQNVLTPEQVGELQNN